MLPGVDEGECHGQWEEQEEGAERLPDHAPEEHAHHERLRAVERGNCGERVHRSLSLFDDARGEVQSDVTPSASGEHAGERVDEPLAGGVPGRCGGVEGEDGAAGKVDRHERGGVPAPTDAVAPQNSGGEVRNDEVGLIHRTHADVVPANGGWVRLQDPLGFGDGQSAEPGLGRDQPILQTFGPKTTTAEPSVDGDLRRDRKRCVDPVAHGAGEVVEKQGEEEGHPTRECDDDVAPGPADRGHESQAENPSGDDLAVRGNGFGRPQIQRGGDHVQQHCHDANLRPGLGGEAEGRPRVFGDEPGNRRLVGRDSRVDEFHRARLPARHPALVRGSPSRGWPDPR